MCLVMLALGMHPDYPLVLAANRDEFHRRPTREAHAWPDAPGVVGGRDLEKGGTWLGVAGRGALAVVTNFRDPANRVTGGPSRGLLVSDFLTSSGTDAGTFVRDRTRPERGYDGFNLIAADAGGVWYGSNRGPVLELRRGLHGLSNHLLDTQWPKVRRTRARFEAALIHRHGTLVQSLFDALRDTDGVADDELPRTGVPLEWERRLAPPFIVSPDYGTRCSTVITIDRARQAVLTERTFDAAGAETGVRTLELTLERLPGQGPETVNARPAE